MRLFAFTNRKCLVNLCEFPEFRCARGEDYQLILGQSAVFEGIEMFNDTIIALNKLITDRMKEEEKKTASEAIKNERSHLPNKIHTVPHPVRSQPYQQPYPTSNTWPLQQPYPTYYTWPQQRTDHLAASQSGNFLHHNIPNTPILQSDTVCCVDELQQL